ncbi:MAG: hypothetical protein LH660_20930 [Phormidesmis sp. CAN_BIN36]|nr:hypothetical protein [Phormidesmis sp. CAN_BIN36]
MTIAEQIYTLVKDLPQEQASEVLTFAELIRTKLLNASSPISPIDPKVSRSTSFKASLTRLHDLTQDLPVVDPVALIQVGREELDERGCV